MTVYWRHGIMRGGTGVRMMKVRGGTGDPYCGGAAGGAWRYLGVPLTTLTTQGAHRGIPGPRYQTRGTVRAGMYIV